jgi:hypothetical protein
LTTLAPTNLRDFPPVEKNIEIPDTLSQSLMAKHDGCPRSAYLSRKYKGGKGSIEAHRGTALHETLERAQNEMIEEGETVTHGEIVRAAAEAVMSERTDLVLPASEQDHIRAMAWNWGESSYGTIDPETIIGIEVPMEVEIAGWRCTSRIDRLEVANNNLYVYDWKSGWPGKKEDTTHSFQGKWYAISLLFGHRVWPDDPAAEPVNLGSGIEAVWFYEVFPRRRRRDDNGEETKELVTLEGCWDRTELFEFKASVERNVAAFEKSLETGVWPAMEGSWCDWCPASAECPIPPHLRQVQHIETPADAEDAFLQALSLEREKARYQSALRAWFKENGPVHVGGYAFDATVQQAREVKDWDALEMALVEAVEAHEPFNREDHIRAKTSTKYGKRKLTKEEMHDADQG